MNYTRKDFESDLKNPDMPHIKDPERFVAFYEELGRGEIQRNQQVVPKRLKFIEPFGTILELGCHVGFNLVHFAKLGHFVTGVDISSTLLEEAQRRKDALPEEIGNRITLIHSDILDLGDLGKFDTIVLTEVLEHVIEPFSILKKAVEYMSRTSKIYVSAPNQQIGNFSHVRGIKRRWMSEAGERLGVSFKFVAHDRETRAIGMLL
jgi:2-polyprenyl-3-methyl-5-hydroxy-6-metoxy-1,4-benzoquinol methylase